MSTRDMPEARVMAAAMTDEFTLSLLLSGVLSLSAYILKKSFSNSLYSIDFNKEYFAFLLSAMLSVYSSVKSVINALQHVVGKRCGSCGMVYGGIYHVSLYDIDMSHSVLKTRLNM